MDLLRPREELSFIEQDNWKTFAVDDAQARKCEMDDETFRSQRKMLLRIHQRAKIIFRDLLMSARLVSIVVSLRSTAEIRISSLPWFPAISQIPVLIILNLCTSEGGPGDSDYWDTGENASFGPNILFKRFFTLRKCSVRSWECVFLKKRLFST